MSVVSHPNVSNLSVRPYRRVIGDYPSLECGVQRDSLLTLKYSFPLEHFRYRSVVWDLQHLLLASVSEGFHIICESLSFRDLIDDLFPDEVNTFVSRVGDSWKWVLVEQVQNCNQQRTADVLVNLNGEEWRAFSINVRLYVVVFLSDYAHFPA